MQCAVDRIISLYTPRRQSDTAIRDFRGGWSGPTLKQTNKASAAEQYLVSNENKKKPENLPTLLTRASFVESLCRQSCAVSNIQTMLWSVRYADTYVIQSPECAAWYIALVGSAQCPVTRCTNKNTIAWIHALDKVCRLAGSGELCVGATVQRPIFLYFFFWEVTEAKIDVKHL